MAYCLVAQVIYETKYHNREWFMRIMIAKRLNGLLKVKMIIKP